ncbi:hypothetical protein EVAR_94470_1 [Eumeta japonica]|uniref:Uncharacterized protein n=1 Tax=Eumeta variegata TaxID=151549 RepID=A0A4C1UUI9_EUMVA|nr:hypothetical protein EVAR_94470_1 [Eumeta japonica]
MRRARAAGAAATLCDSLHSARRSFTLSHGITLTYRVISTYRVGVTRRSRSMHMHKAYSNIRQTYIKDDGSCETRHGDGPPATAEVARPRAVRRRARRLPNGALNVICLLRITSNLFDPIDERSPPLPVPHTRTPRPARGRCTSSIDKTTVI